MSPVCQACGEDIKPGEAFATVKYRMAYRTQSAMRDGSFYTTDRVARKKDKKPARDDDFHLKCGLAQRYQDGELK